MLIEDSVRVLQHCFRLLSCSLCVSLTLFLFSVCFALSLCLSLVSAVFVLSLRLFLFYVSVLSLPFCLSLKGGGSAASTIAIVQDFAHYEFGLLPEHLEILLPRFGRWRVAHLALLVVARSLLASLS